MSLSLKRLGIWALAGLGFATTNLAAIDNARASDWTTANPAIPSTWSSAISPITARLGPAPSSMACNCGRAICPLVRRSNFTSACRARSSSTPCWQARRASAISAICQPIVGATKRNVADLRILANIGLGHDECNVFFVRSDAPQFADAKAAVGLAQRQDRRHAERKLLRSLRASRLPKEPRDAERLSQSKHRSHHQRLPRRQDRTAPCSGSRQPPASSPKASLAASPAVTISTSRTVRFWMPVRISSNSGQMSSRPGSRPSLMPNSSSPIQRTPAKSLNS